MNPRRRAWLLQTAAAGAALAAPPARRTALAATVPPAGAAPVQRGRRLEFPRDHGTHEAARTEWWYATGWLAPRSAGAASPTAPRFGFQITFFRSRTGLAQASRSRFAARHVLFAHAAITDLVAGRHLHAQRIARFASEELALADSASSADTRLVIAAGGLTAGAWRFWRDELRAEPATPAGAGRGVSRWQAQVRSERFSLSLALTATQPLLLQGDAGFSRKGPEESQASHYYSAPQLQASAQLRLGEAAAPAVALNGRAWLDHEWSDELMHPAAVGWDWIGMNLEDGSALTAFRLRRADGTALWAGGSWRAADQQDARSFGATEVQWTPGRRWLSSATNASYPVQWRVDTPTGRYDVRALLDAQELDSRGNTGAVYWEGLAELLDAAGRRVGLGYLEMTGYASALRLG